MNRRVDNGLGSTTVAVMAASLASRADLDGAIERIGRRFGTRAMLRGDAAERQASERRFLTGTSFDRLAGGIRSGAPLAFVGQGSSGKLALALRAVAGAQCEGGHALWLDPTGSLDAGAADRAGVDLERLIVVRARAREDVIRSAAAGLRSDGLRLVVVDTGCALAPAEVTADQLAPLVPLVRGSTAALLVIADRAPARLALPTYAFERVAWQRRFERTSGWSFSVSRGRRDAAIFQAGALGRTFADSGLGPEHAEGLAS